MVPTCICLGLQARPEAYNKHKSNKYHELAPAPTNASGKVAGDFSQAGNELSQTSYAQSRIARMMSDKAVALQRVPRTNTHAHANACT